jgi:hypothetical protein
VTINDSPARFVSHHESRNRSRWEIQILPEQGVSIALTGIARGHP